MVKSRQAISVLASFRLPLLALCRPRALAAMPVFTWETYSLFDTVPNLVEQLDEATTVIRGAGRIVLDHLGRLGLREHVQP